MPALYHCVGITNDLRCDLRTIDEYKAEKVMFVCTSCTYVVKRGRFEYYEQIFSDESCPRAREMKIEARIWSAIATDILSIYIYIPGLPCGACIHGALLGQASVPLWLIISVIRCSTHISHAFGAWGMQSGAPGYTPAVMIRAVEVELILAPASVNRKIWGKHMLCIRLDRDC